MIKREGDGRSSDKDHDRGKKRNVYERGTKDPAKLGVEGETGRRLLPIKWKGVRSSKRWTGDVEGGENGAGKKRGQVNSFQGKKGNVK